MGLKRRSRATPEHVASRIAALHGTPAVRQVVLRDMLAKNTYSYDEMLTVDFMQPHRIMDWRLLYDTLVPGVVGPVATYNINLASIGFSGAAEYGPASVVTVEITDGVNTHRVQIDAADAFTSASSGGNFTLNGGAPGVINRSAGTLSISTMAATDDLSAATWKLTAFIAEVGSELSVGLAGTHGRDSEPGGNPDAKWNGGASQLIIPKSADMASEIIYSQSLMHATTWPTTGSGFMVAVLMSPLQHWRDSLRLFYSQSDNPSTISSTLVAINHETATDLLGDSLNYWTLPATLAGSAKYLTIAFNFGSAAARLEPSSLLGFGVGVK